MKEKELRLAVVCYGGVSLAIYEHGITKEMLKLARASKAYQRAADEKTKQEAGHTFRAAAGDEPDSSTEEVYFDLLKAIGRTLDLRIVVDVIAGSSAGGINGITLARALAHDLSLEPLTDMWLEKADIQRLLAPEAKARMWSKWYVRPFMDPLMWRLEREGLTPPEADAEMQAALSTFFRSRWFRPPLDGKGFTALLLDGLQAMGNARPGRASLLPPGHELDLIVTVTDFYGSARTIFIHDPPMVQEREHRHSLRFAFEHPHGAPMISDFGPDHLPSLAFAARATASFPGAFPPAQIQEIDAVLAERRQPWMGRARFLGMNFRHYADLGIAPESAVLVDGSVLNNKPLSEAIAAARTHRAFREVDRRLVYIDPHPNKELPKTLQGPGFFTTLRGALSDLPRYEPIYDELLVVGRHNREVQQRRAVVDATRTHVRALVDRISEGRLTQPVSPEALRRWRLNGPNLVASTGLVFNGWIRLVIGESVEFVARLLAKVCLYPDISPQTRWIEEVVTAAARKLGVYMTSYEYPTADREAALPPFGKFIANFGVKYKRRRLIFVIQAINKLYRQRYESEHCEIDASALDVLKRRLYRCLDSLRVYDDTQFLGADLVAKIHTLFGRPQVLAADGTLPDAETFATGNDAALSAIMARLSDECDLVGLNEDVDAVLASPSVFELGPDCQTELLMSYVGFLFWDIVLLPMTVGGGSDDSGALEEILIDRISPEDATTIRLPGKGSVLRGGSLGGFGGFFGRAMRENDYLWGRLHAVDRLIDLVVSTARHDVAGAGIDLRAFKKRGFESVLKGETARLPHSADLITRLQAFIESL